MEEQHRLCNVDNGHLHSKGYFHLSEIGTVLHAGKQQLQAKQGRSKSKQFYPPPLKQKEDAICRHWGSLGLCVCNVLSAFTTLCFVSWNPSPSSFLSVVSLQCLHVHPFMSLQFTWRVYEMFLFISPPNLFSSPSR